MRECNSTVQYSSVQFSSVQYSAVQCSALYWHSLQASSTFVTDSAVCGTLSPNSGDNDESLGDNEDHGGAPLLWYHRNCIFADRVNDDVLSAIRCRFSPSECQNAWYFWSSAHRCMAGVSA